MAVLGGLALVLIIGLSILIWAERGKLLQPSTRRALAEAGWKNWFNGNDLFMYAYLRWPAKYIKVIRWALPRVRNKGENRVGDTYHGKVLTPEQANEIINFHGHIHLQDLEQIIPYPTARNIVLSGPPDIVALDCPCRESSAHPCSPSRVCLIIGQPFADFTLEHYPEKCERLNTKQALALLEQVHNQGCIHTAYFKESCLDRFYCICNCCKCCCAGLEAMVKHGFPIMAPSGYSALIAKDKCISCGACKRACPFEAITDDCLIIRDKCMGCGVCVTTCPTQAVTLRLDPSRGIPLEVKQLV